MGGATTNPDCYFWMDCWKKCISVCVCHNKVQTFFLYLCIHIVNGYKITTVFFFILTIYLFLLELEDIHVRTDSMLCSFLAVGFFIVYQPHLLAWIINDQNPGWICYTYSFTIRVNTKLLFDIETKARGKKHKRKKTQHAHYLQYLIQLLQDNFEFAALHWQITMLYIQTVQQTW